MIKAAEDLMREHGILNRILLIYEAIIYKDIEDASLSIRAALIVRKFIEDYHEEMEERYIFPYLQDRGIYVELIDILKHQHNIGRELTSRILASGDKDAMEKFIHMYRAHETREDTEVFPVYHNLASSDVYNNTSNIFEETEMEIFGDHGYNRVLEEVVHIERRLGISDLSVYNISIM